MCARTHSEDGSGVDAIVLRHKSSPLNNFQNAQFLFWGRGKKSMTAVDLLHVDIKCKFRFYSRNFVLEKKKNLSSFFSLPYKRTDTHLHEICNVGRMIKGQAAMEHSWPLRGGATPLTAAHRTLAAQYRRAPAELNCSDSFVVGARFMCSA